MFKKIMIILGLVAVCAVFSGYFYCAGRYSVEQADSMRCNDINVIIKNSQKQNFISEDEVAAMINKSVKGSRIDEINTYAIEQLLCSSSAISQAEAYIVSPTTLTLEVTQRNPVVRFQTPNGGFYCDSSGFILPLLGKVTLNLPVVDGNLQFAVPASGSGYPEKGMEWLHGLLNLTENIRSNPYWSQEIQQIWVEPNTDIVLYTKSGNEKFIFGNTGDIDAKFKKMSGYYRTIKPEAKAKGKVYTSVNLKYKDQIICK